MDIFSAGEPAPKSPASQGYRMPAEWEPQEAVWFTWPTNSDTWLGRHDKVHAALAHAASSISRTQNVSIICAKGQQAAMVQSLHNAGADLDRVQYFDIESDDAWCRDHGPTYVINKDSGKTQLVDWRYNGWGSKYPSAKDDAVPQSLSMLLMLPRYRSTLVCEGGALEVNSAGQLITTESVLLNPNRNTELGKEEVEHELKECLGVSEITWMPGGIAGDDTDGHVDMCCRFFADDGIALCIPDNPTSPDYKTLSLNREIAEGMKTSTEGRFHIAKLPYPDPVELDGLDHPACASYLNFLITNEAVLVPTYDQRKKDTEALGLLGELFSTREVVGIDCREFVREGGAIHCLTQQQPAC